MKFILLVSALLVLSGCRSTPEMMPYTPSEHIEGPAADPNAGLKAALGMARSPADLGFVEKAFNPCSFGLAGSASCKQQYFSVVHFQLLCRDTEGSVSAMPISPKPIVANDVKWKVAGISGGTHTDGQGYGQFTVRTSRSARGQRLILRIGPQFVAFDVSEVSKIVLPKNFCRTS